MAAGNNEQTITLTRRIAACATPNARVVGESAVKKKVVPATHLIDRHLDARIIGVNCPLLPIRVVRRVMDPIQIPGIDGSETGIAGKRGNRKRRVSVQRECGDELHRIRLAGYLMIELIGGELRSPGLCEILL